MKNTPDLWLKNFPHPSKEGNKYDRGHLVVSGGEIACTGATKIAARSALRAGAGLVSVACDATALPIYAAAFSAVMTKLVSSVEDFSSLIADERVTAVLIGCGGGVTQKTQDFVLTSLSHGKKTVLDADALSIFTKNPDKLFSAIKSEAILTPHEGEFKRLFGSLISDNDDRLERARKAANISGAVVILKGFNTIIAAPDGAYAINENATPYLATAGSGDALAGIAASLLAQGMHAFNAACAAVWLHGEVASRFGAGLIAEDIAEGIPSVLQEIYSSQS